MVLLEVVAIGLFANKNFSNKAEQFIGINPRNEMKDMIRWFWRK